MMIKSILILCLTLAGEHLVAQEYPNKPIRLIVPFPPGGSTDLVGRHLARHLPIELGQAIVIENRGGAYGIVGAQAAAAAAPDGYTLFLAASSVMAVNAALYAKLPYDPNRSFAPVSLLIKQPLLIAVHPAVPARSLAELVGLAKSRPGQLNFAGVGTSTSLPMFQLNRMAGIRIQEVPYAGGGPGLMAAVSGQVEVINSTLVSMVGQLKAGKIRGIAVMSARRSPLAPEVPTVAESGFPGFEADVWNGLAVPAGTPRDIIVRLHRAIVNAMTQADAKETFSDKGIEVATSTPEGFGEFIRNESARWDRVGREEGIVRQ